MRLLHTSDWHLGKRLYRLERLPEQELFLQELIALIKREQVDHLILAGDVFDVPLPPHRALRLFYDFISQLLRETAASFWVIGGNHDSGALLDAPTNLIDPARVHLFGGLRENIQEHWVKLAPDLTLGLLPYFRAHELARWAPGEEMAAALRKFLQHAPAAGGKLLCAHHLFGLFEAAGSEQALALSGLDSIPLEWLQGLDYVALGHIHKAQTLKKSAPLVRYCGSPLPLRFSETTAKGVELLVWDEGVLQHRTLPLTTQRHLVSITTTNSAWRERLSELPKAALPTAVELILQLEAPQTGLIDEIKLYAEAQGLELLSIYPEFLGAQERKTQTHWSTLLNLAPEELFAAFYAQKYPEAPQVPDDLLRDLRELWEEARHAAP